MGYNKTILLWIIFGLQVQQCYGVGSSSVERQLYLDLFSNYSPEIRPVEGYYWKQVVVSAQFGITQIEALNERQEQLISHGYVSFSWADEILQWNPSEYDNITILIVPSEKVWLPEMSPTNSVSDSNELAFAESESRVRIFDTGVVNWVPLMQWSTSCAISIADFPYDQQECTVDFGSWMYPTQLVNFSITPTVALSQYTNNSAWDLVETEVLFSENKEGAPIFFPEVTMKITLRRIPLFFEINVVMPAVLLSILLIPMFMLPVDSGEKVSLGITLMLSYSIFLLILTEYTPVSGSSPRIALAILICMIFAGMGLFVNVAIINIHHHLPNRDVPGWMKRIILNKIGSGLCCMKYSGSQSGNGKVAPENVSVKCEDGEKASKKTETDTLIEYLEFFKAKQLESEETDQKRENWNKVARVLDRTFLIVYAIYCAAFIIAILVLRGSQS